MASAVYSNPRGGFYRNGHAKPRSNTPSHAPTRQATLQTRQATLQHAKPRSNTHVDHRPSLPSCNNGLVPANHRQVTARVVQTHHWDRAPPVRRRNRRPCDLLLPSRIWRKLHRAALHRDRHVGPRPCRQLHRRPGAGARAGLVVGCAVKSWGHWACATHAPCVQVADTTGKISGHKSYMVATMNCLCSIVLERVDRL
jgi:hypothetical protein